MQRYLVALIVSSTLVAPAFAADSYTIDPEFTTPAFEIGHLGFTTQRGHFDKTSGKVTLDLAAKTGSVDFTIYTTSLDMGTAVWSKAWVAHLSDDGLFNVMKFPTMNFKSDKLIFEGNKVVAAEGQFTLLGVSKPLKVEVKGFQCGANPMNKKPMCTGDVTAALKRSDFGMTKYIPAVSDEVKISVPVEAYKN